MKNNSILIITWDEDDGSQGNHISTIFYGASVKPGQYSEKITHYSVLRAIEQMYQLKHLGSAANAKPIRDLWKKP